MSRRLRGAAVVLVVVLALSAGLLAVARQDRNTFPSIRSHGPSGTRAFAELLRSEGIRVDLDQTTNPKLKPGDVAIALFVSEDPSDELRAPWLQTLESNLDGPLSDGAAIIVSQIPPDFREATQAAKYLQDVHLAIDQSHWEVSMGEPASGELPFAVADGTAIFSGPQVGGFALAGHYGSGHVVQVTSGIGATNQFIAKGDNAAAWLHLVKMQLEEGGRVVFLEATFSPPVDPGKLASIGAWLSYAWWQLVLGAIVVAYALGKPFGYDWGSRVRQRGTRDLADALASIMARAKHTEPALAAVARRVRSKYSTDTERVKRAEETLRRAQAAPSVKDALRLSIELERDQPDPASQ